MSELSATLRANTQDLQDAINRLSISEDTTMDTKEAAMPETEEVELDRPGLGFCHPAADRVPHAPSAQPGPAFVRPETHPPVFMPVRYVVAPQNNAFCKLLAFPESFPSISNYLVNMLQSCSERELLSLFAKFMHAPMTEAYARRILEAYIPMTGPVHARGSLVSGGAPGVASRVWALLL